MTQYNAVGLRALHVTAIDTSTGIAIGGLTAAAAGASANPYRLHGAFNLPSAIPEPTRLFPLGDDSVVASYQMPASELSNGTLQLSTEDQDWVAYTQATNTVTLGAWTHGLTNPIDQGFIQNFFITHKQAKTVPGGLAQWKTEVLFGNATFLGQGSGHQSIDYYQYAVAYNRMTKYPWGVAMVDGTEGTTAASTFGGYNQYPWILGTATGDGTAMSVDLLYTPYEDSANSALVWVDGTLQTYTTNYTVDTANKQIDFVTTPATDAQIVVWYGFSDWG